MKLGKVSVNSPTVLIAGLVAVPVVWAVYLAILLQPFTSVPARSAEPETAASHRAAALWGACFVAYMVAAVWNLAVSRLILKRYLDERFRWPTFAVAVLAAAIGLFARVSYGSRTAPLSLVVRGDVPIYDITKIGNSITAALITLLVATGGVLVHRRPREVMTAKNLRRRIALSKLSLYSAAALLIVGVVQIYFLNDWPANIFAADVSKANRDGLHELAYTAAVVSGVLYSVILMMIYAPVLLIHDRWASQLAERAAALDPALDFAKWRDERGLGRSVTGTLSEVGAVVGPWLAAVGVPQLLPGA